MTNSLNKYFFHSILRDSALLYLPLSICIIIIELLLSFNFDLFSHKDFSSLPFLVSSSVSLVLSLCPDILFRATTSSSSFTLLTFVYLCLASFSFLFSLQCDFLYFLNSHSLCHLPFYSSCSCPILLFLPSFLLSLSLCMSFSLCSIHSYISFCALPSPKIFSLHISVFLFSFLFLTIPSFILPNAVLH